MHENKFLSSWLTEVGEDKNERGMDADGETKEEVSKKRTREEETEENETVVASRRCVNSVSIEAFDILAKRRIRRAVVILGVICGMILVVYLTVIL